MINTLIYIDSILFLCSVAILVYLYVFAIASHFRHPPYPKAEKLHKYAVLLPNGTDFTTQDYPAELYQVIPYENLFEAMETLKISDSEMVVILEETAQARPTLLAKLNDIYDAGIKAVQLHRILADRKTFGKHLQAVREEIYNQLYKQGNTQLGLSSALDRTNIAIDREWLMQNLKSEKSHLERKLLRQEFYIDYLRQSPVESLFPKVQSYPVSLRRILPRLFPMLVTGNWSYFHRIVQWTLPSPLKLCIFTAVWTLFTTGYDWTLSLKWWGLAFFLALGISLAIPDYLVEDKKKKRKH